MYIRSKCSGTQKIIKGKLMCTNYMCADVLFYCFSDLRFSEMNFLFQYTILRVLQHEVPVLCYCISVL